MLKLAGKVEPDTEKLNEFSDYGFNHFELYLSTSILDEMSVEEIVTNCKKADPNIATVHTPHVSTEKSSKKYFKKTDEIAEALDAVLVFDSNPTSTRYAPDIFPSNAITAPTHGYENDPGTSEYYLKNFHLQNDLPLVLDTAHLHMSESTILPFVEELLSACETEQLPVVHLADGTIQNDGVAFGDGSVDIASVVNLLETYDYEGVVVLEVPQSAQAEALETVKDL